MREQAVDSFSLSAVSSAGTMASPSRIASRASPNRPVAASDVALAKRRSTRSPNGALSGNSRSAPENHRTAIAGARGAEIRPASASVATAAISPVLAEMST